MITERPIDGTKPDHVVFTGIAEKPNPGFYPLSDYAPNRASLTNDSSKLGRIQTSSPMVQRESSKT
jgi:hypothetical protein